MIKDKVTEFTKTCWSGSLNKISMSWHYPTQWKLWAFARNFDRDLWGKVSRWFSGPVTSQNFMFAIFKSSKILAQSFEHIFHYLARHSWIVHLLQISANAIRDLHKRKFGLSLLVTKDFKILRSTFSTSGLCSIYLSSFEFVCHVLRIDDKKPDGLNDFKFSGCINLAQQEEVGTIGTHVPWKFSVKQCVQIISKLNSTCHLVHNSHNGYGHLPVFRFVDVHAAVVPGELLARLNALVLCCELAGPVLLQLLNVGVQASDWDGRVTQHPRGLNIF